jgi:hypothetical protein
LWRHQAGRQHSPGKLLTKVRILFAAAIFLIALVFSLASMLNTMTSCDVRKQDQRKTFLVQIYLSLSSKTEAERVSIKRRTCDAVWSGRWGPRFRRNLLPPSSDRQNVWSSHSDYSEGAIFWDVTPCNIAIDCRGFGGKYCLHPQGGRVSQGSNYQEASIGITLKALFSGM